MGQSSQEQTTRHSQLLGGVQGEQEEQEGTRLGHARIEQARSATPELVLAFTHG